MTVYQLTASFRDRLENSHKEHSKKVFLDKTMAEEYKDRFASLVADMYGQRRGSGITITIIELEVIE